MRQVRKKLIAKRVVADVLDDAAAVGIGAGMLQLLGSQGWIAAQQQGNDAIFPGQIDQLFVGQNRVGSGRLAQAQAQGQKNYRE